MSLLRFQDIYANLNSSTSRFILQQSAAWTSRSSRAATISYPKPIENSVLTMYPSIHFPLTPKPDSTLWTKSHKKVIQSLKCFLFIFLVWWCKYKHVLYISQVFVSFLLYYAVFIDISQFLKKNATLLSIHRTPKIASLKRKKEAKRQFVTAHASDMRLLEKQLLPPSKSWGYQELLWPHGNAPLERPLSGKWYHSR